MIITFPQTFIFPQRIDIQSIFKNTLIDYFCLLSFVFLFHLDPKKSVNRKINGMSKLSRDRQLLCFELSNFDAFAVLNSFRDGHARFLLLSSLSYQKRLLLKKAISTAFDLIIQLHNLKAELWVITIKKLYIKHICINFILKITKNHWYYTHSTFSFVFLTQ